MPELLGKPITEMTPAEVAAQIAALTEALTALKTTQEAAAKVNEQVVFTDLGAYATSLVREKLGILKGLTLHVRTIVPPDGKAFTNYEVAYTPEAAKAKKAAAKGEGKGRTVEPNGGKATVAKIAAALGGIETIKVGDNSYKTAKDACKGLGLVCWENDGKGDGAGSVIIRYALEKPGTVTVTAPGGATHKMEDVVTKWKAASKTPAAVTAPVVAPAS